MKYQIENKDYYFWQFPVTIGNRRWYLEPYQDHRDVRCWRITDPIEIIRINDNDIDCYDDGKRYNFAECRFNTLDPEKHLNIR